MPDLFRLISEYFWALGLGFGLFNYSRARRALVQSATGTGSDLENSLGSLRGFAFASLSPWFLMGLGQLSGLTPNIWYFFRPQDGNPFVVAWFILVFLLAVGYAWWVIVAGGARRTRDLHLMELWGHYGRTPSEGSIKLMAAAGVLGLPVWLYLAVLSNAQVPK